MAIETRNADPDAPFTLASLVSEAGIAGNGEKLVRNLKHHYPTELKAAMLKRINRTLTDGLDQAAIESIAKVVGAARDSDLNVKVHGGQSRTADAVITYAFHDADGQLWKGFFPYSEVGKASPNGHVSQRESLAGSPAAEDYAKSQAKARAAQRDPEADALRAEVEELRAQLEEQADPDDPAPVRGYQQAKATDIATMLSAAPRETAVRVHEYESAHDKRKTVVEAAEKRIASLEADDAAAAAAQAAQVAENETLKKRIAALEAAQTTPSTSET